MTAFAAGLLLAPMVDQAIKFLLRRRLGAGWVSLGLLGRVQMVPAQIWLARHWGRPRLALIWTVWLLSAGALTVLSVLAPSCAWCAGLLLGGSISHALETSWRGGISDYVCLRFWPAFNAADLAITVGALGLVGNVLHMMVTT